MQFKTPLKNALVPEHIPTYEGSNQSTHPSVLYFPEGWHGYSYWMGMTPYPYNNDGFEDPSILASRNGRDWEVPPGVKNPLTPKPEPGHNCDVDLVYDPVADALRMYYVEADDLKQSWVKLMESRDGIHWSAPKIVVHDPDYMYGILSPSIELLPDGNYYMWYVDTGNTGYVNQNNRVRVRTSPDGYVWSEQRDSELTQPGWQIWHIDVHFEPATGLLHAFYPAYPDGGNCDGCALFYAVKQHSGPWKVFSGPVLAPGPEGAWDDFCIYRSSMLLDRGSDRMRIWYGGKKSDASWNMGYVESGYEQFWNGLEQMERGNKA